MPSLTIPVLLPAGPLPGGDDKEDRPIWACLWVEHGPALVV